jgi:transcriptional regulator with AAA-type ATPase domain/transcriptional regulatory protein LevR
MTRKQNIYEFLRKMKSQYGLNASYTTEEIANAVGASRANTSADLNRLFEEELVEKLPGWPVKYRASTAVLTPMPNKTAELSIENGDSVFEEFIGFNGSMSLEIEKAKAAVLYPLSGLPMLVGGPTGVGKTTFAKLMYEYARKVGCIAQDAKFLCFNCADYADNPQLITAQLFGCAKGAYTGADEERIGIVEQADGGVLFLDEVHRLPKTAQEMLFFLIDFGQFRRLGESNITRVSRPIIIMATTENKDSALLATFRRRVPITITLPTIAERSLLERLKLVKHFFTAEAKKLGLDIKVDSLAIKALLAYDCPGNVGQLESDIKVACARAYVACLMGKKTYLDISILDLPLHVKEGIRKLKHIYSDINLISSDFEVHLNEKAIKSTNIIPKQHKDIYEILEKRHYEYSQDVVDKDFLEIAMMLDIESYFSDLLRSDKELLLNDDSFDNISQKALNITYQAEEILKRELKLTLDERSRVAIAFHISGTLKRMAASKTIVCPLLPRIQKNNPDIFNTAIKIVQMIREHYHVALPDDEVGFLANILMLLKNDSKSVLSCGLLVVCYGLGSAKKMAKIANDILGTEFVCWLDITKELSQKELNDSVVEKLSKMETYDSFLVLVDSQTLLNVLLNIKNSFEKPLYALDNISTSMVIEAALMLTEHQATAQQTYYYLKSFEQSYNELYEIETKKITKTDEKKVIVTACISGCGAAIRLKRVIEERFQIPDNIEIVTMDISSISALKNRIAKLSSTREVICVIGMDVGLEISFPFISIEEFVLGNGIQRLSNILSNYHINQRFVSKYEDTGEELENIFLSREYLNNYLFYLDGDKIAPYLRICIENVEKSRGKMHAGKRIMLCIHICAMVEKLLFEPVAEDKNKHAKVAQDIVAALEPLSSAYHIKIPPEEYEMVEQILALAL